MEFKFFPKVHFHIEESFRKDSLICNSKFKCYDCEYYLKSFELKYKISN